MHRRTTRSTLAEDKKWRDATFDTPPARQVAGRSRPTQRSRIQDPTGREHICEGGNELTAAMLLNHLCRLGLVRRYKFQPFNLQDFGGESGYPDLLVELSTSELVVVEVKSAKFLTSDYLDKYRARERELIALGIPAVLWTDKKAEQAIEALTHSARNNLLDLERCSQITAADEVLARLRVGVSRGRVRLTQLLTDAGATWEELMYAWAHNYVQAPIKEKLHETTLFAEAASHGSYRHYFDAGSGSASWWESLPSLTLN